MAECQIESNTPPYMYRLRPIYLDTVNLWLVDACYSSLSDTRDLIALESYDRTMKNVWKDLYDS